MAQRVEVTVTDDLDGSVGAEKVMFGFGRDTFEIDLNEKNRTALEKALAKYIEHGKRVGAGTRRPRTGTPVRRGLSTNGEDPRMVREWATANGIEINARGRIPATVMEQYHAAK